MNPYISTLNLIKSLEHELKNLWIDNNFIEYFVKPDRVVKANLTIKMDNWEVKTFEAYRSQHKNLTWPYKWWIRFHQQVYEDEVVALSLWMTLKTSLLNLPLWWWKWWVKVDPKLLSNNELEKLSREYVRAFYPVLWDDIDIPAPDVNTNSLIMSWMIDEYNKISWRKSYGSFTWKPIEIWWSKVRDIATALWWFYVINYITNLKDKKIVIKWAWNAWLNFAKLAADYWANIIAISDSKGWIYWDNLDLNSVLEVKKKWWSVVDLNEKKISNEDILWIECDILVLAALENDINENNLDKVKAKYILELANWPITPDADEILYKKWIVVIPDILANAWWVTVSYFEQVQNKTLYYWSEEEIKSKLKQLMINSAMQVINFSTEKNISLRKASYILSIYRQFKAYKYIYG